MTLKIPLVAPGRSAESLADLLSPLRAQGIEIGKPATGGLAADPGAINLILEVAKVTLPALLSAIATIWAAKIGKGGMEKATVQVHRRNRLVLELDASEVVIDLDASGQPVTFKDVPSRLNE